MNNFIMSKKTKLKLISNLVNMSKYYSNDRVSK